MSTEWHPRYNPWLIAVIVSLAAFMEVLDTSIANVALPHIAGNLGASTDESTWVLTSYLVSNAIVLPITGWLVSRFGRKRFFLICITLFTLSSLLCGIAPSLPILLLARIIQGAGGGGLQPMAQAILADSFPPARRGAAFAVFGITVIFAPAIGPTLGGWVTDNYSWRWIFLMNLPVGIIALALVNMVVEDPPFLKRLKNARIDLIGFSLLTVGVAALQIMLDKGQEDDWFNSRFITTLAAVSITGLVALVVWEWRQKDPLVDVRLFQNRNFATTSIMMFFVGAVLFSSTVLLPQYLQLLMGYSAESAGVVLSLGAVAMFFVMPIVGQLSSRIQARYLIAFGWIGVAASMYLSVHMMNTGMSFSSAAKLRVLQLLPVPFIFIPATLVSYLGLPPGKNSSAAGLINFMRNIGSGVGTSGVIVMVTQRTQVHQTMLASHTSMGDAGFVSAVRGLAAQLAHSGVVASQAQMQALDRMYGLMMAQAASIAYLDAYMMLSVGGAIMFFLAFILRKNDPHQGGASSAPAH
ncbi:MAG TPA: DHA2 family efflux MFS transporter permease subunit [Bryobacteraceae bacterium]